MKKFFLRVKSSLKRAWQWYKRQFKGQPWWRKTIAGFISFIVFCLLYAVAVQVNFLWLFGDSPSVREIIHPKTDVASEVYSDDGILLHKFFSENRSPVKYEEISQHFIDALISTEDERFYQHSGIDFVGLFAAFKDAARGHARGASTISQQLVKNIHKMRSKHTGLLGYIPGVKMIIMKSKEMIIATELEMVCSKEEILTMYANTVDFGSNAYGIKTAAKTYFGTTPKDLTVEEAAVLVGLLKATTAYNPKINPKNALRRRNTVIDNMYTHGHLTRSECDSLKNLPIELRFSIENAYDGKALYFRQAVLNELRNVAPELDPYTDGLKIYTTLDSRMQRYAEEAVREQMRKVQTNFEGHWGNSDPWVDDRNQPIPGFLEAKIKQTDTYRYLAARYPDNPEIILQKLREPHPVKLFSYDGPKEAVMSSLDSLRYMLRFMHTGFVAIEPETGYVRAYVGDIDFKTWKHDNVMASHQPGSTFKLFVYSAAMKYGLCPADRRRDEYIQMDVYDKGKKTVWRPHNADGRISGANMPLRTAFAKSINTVAVKVGQEVGIPRVIATAKDMGIVSPLDDAPSLALGACDVTPYELISAYTTVANYGVHVKPFCITRVEDADGRVIYTARAEKRTALTEKEAYYMQVLLGAGVSDGGGTSQTVGSQAYLGQWYWNKKLSLGGKTGTSNSHADAWFVGVTPKLVGGAWVGGEYRQIHFRTGALGQGSRTALPIFGLFMKKVLEDPQLSDKYLAVYKEPDGIDPSSIEGYTEYAEPDSLTLDSAGIADLRFDPDAEVGEHEDPAADAAGKTEKTPDPAAEKTTVKEKDDDDLFN